MSVHVVGPSAVGAAQRGGHAGIAMRGQDQVDVVGHETVCPDLDIRAPGLLGQHVGVQLLVAVFEEDRLAPIAPRCDVVRASRSHDARQPSHAPSLAAQA